MNSTVVMIAWKDAHNACRSLNRRYGHLLRDGYVFRLPMEGEWEAIARCGNNRKYPWGNDWPPTPMADGVMPNLQGIEVISIEGQVPPAIRIIPGYKDGWPSVAPVKKVARMSGASMGLLETFRNGVKDGMTKIGS